jgi:hypothetical protein
VAFDRVKLAERLGVKTKQLPLFGALRRLDALPPEAVRHFLLRRAGKTEAEDEASLSRLDLAVLLFFRQGGARLRGPRVRRIVRSGEEPLGRYRSATRLPVPTRPFSSSLLGPAIPGWQLDLIAAEFGDPSVVPIVERIVEQYFCADPSPAEDEQVTAYTKRDPPALDSTECVISGDGRRMEGRPGLVGGFGPLLPCASGSLGFPADAAVLRRPRPPRQKGGL